MFEQNRTHIIDRESPIPIYHQIASDIIERISLGEWRMGEKLPSEAVFYNQYGVSLMTLRQALKYLEETRLIEKFQGKGTFLRDTPKPFIEDLSLPGTVPEGTRSVNTVKIVEWRREAAPSPYLLQTFHISSLGPVLFLRRLFLRQNRLIGLNDVWFPEKLVPKLMEEGLLNESITTTLRKKYGYEIVNVDNYIESAKLNATEAALLEVPYDSHVLRIYSTHCIKSGQAVEYSCTSWLGNLTRFHLNVDKCNKPKKIK